MRLIPTFNPGRLEGSMRLMVNNSGRLEGSMRFIAHNLREARALCTSFSPYSSGRL